MRKLLLAAAATVSLAGCAGTMNTPQNATCIMSAMPHSNAGEPVRMLRMVRMPGGRIVDGSLPGVVVPSGAPYCPDSIEALTAPLRTPEAIAREAKLAAAYNYAHRKDDAAMRRCAEWLDQMGWRPIEPLDEVNHLFVYGGVYVCKLGSMSLVVG